METISLSEGTKCHVHPATIEDLDWILRLEIDTYTAQHAVARRRLEGWYGANPDGFSVLTINGRRIGHLTFVPLRAETSESLVLGRISENDIHQSCLHPPEEKHLIKSLYVESIILDSSNGHSTLPIKALTCLAQVFVPLIRRICDPNSLENLFALAATGRGERLMKGLGFNQIKSGGERLDNRALYVATFSALKNNISELYSRRTKKNGKTAELEN